MLTPRDVPPGARPGQRSRPVALMGLLVALVCFSSPATAFAQPVEFDAGWHDVAGPRSDNALSGPVQGVEQLPPGLAIAGRYMWARVFLQFDAALGTGEGDGTICGDILATNCEVERIEYGTGLLALSVGRHVRLFVDQPWELRARPRLGLGLISASEKAVNSNRQHSESRPAMLAGIHADVRYRPDSRWVSAFGAFAGLDIVRPFAENCLDCRQILDGWLPRYSLGLTINPGTGPSRRSAPEAGRSDGGP